MKTRLSCYDVVLLTLLRFNYATRKSLLLLNFSNTSIYEAIQYGERQKTICTSPLRYRRVKGERRHTSTYMTITTRGLQYLVENCSQHVEWLKYLPSDLSRIRIRGYKCATSQVERFLRMSAAAQAAESIGASVRPLYLSTDKVLIAGGGEEAIDYSADIDATDDDLVRAPDLFADTCNDMNGILDDDDWMDFGIEDGIGMECEAGPGHECEAVAQEPSVEDSGATCRGEAGERTSREPQRLLSTVVYEAINRAGNRDTKETCPMVFHPVREVKARLAASLDRGDATLAARDLMSCRYSGLLESCSNNVLVYVPNAMGMDWRERIVRKELATQMSFAKLYSQFGPISHDEQNGVVLVQNERMLEDVYFDKKSRRGENEILGRSFNHYYVVQYNKDGMSDLKRIMTRNLEADGKKFIERAIQSGVYTSNTEVSAKLFPLQSKEGILVADGTLMDLVQVNAIESIANHIQGIKYGVLCRPHQLPYYQRIMPRAYFMLVG